MSHKVSFWDNGTGKRSLLNLTKMVKFLLLACCYQKVAKPPRLCVPNTAAELRFGPQV